ncbi:MAG: single-stranded DNA-binding protein [Planctomycetes bacterium]|nr:single-stranded DNA-binding protein [Planctomycetota bacterium]
MSFSDLKKRRGRKGTEALAEEAAKMNKPGGSFDDDRFWKPTRDKSDNGFAVIRFLPAVEGEDIPWVRIFSHAYKGPKGQWYIENCPTTISGDCPACKRNSELWNSGIDANKDIARKRKRRLQYISNVYIVSDPKNPENEGKVFLYKYGVKIFTKLMDAMDPDFEDEASINPFCFWEGADFKIKIRRVKGFVNYDKSEFASASKFLDGNDEALEAMYAGQYKLQPFIDNSEFKKYEELRNRVETVLETGDSPRSSAADKAAEEDVQSSGTSPGPDSSPSSSPVTNDDDDSDSGMVEATVPASNEDESDTKDAKSYFEDLADED